MKPWGHFFRSGTRDEVFDYWWRRGCRNEFQFEEPCIKCVYRFECACIWILTLYNPPFNRLFLLSSLLHLYKVLPDERLLFYWGKRIRPNFVKRRFATFREHWNVAWQGNTPICGLPPLVFPQERMDFEQFYRIGGIVRNFVEMYTELGKPSIVYVPSDTGLEVFRWKEEVPNARIYAIRRSLYGPPLHTLPFYEEIYKDVEKCLDELFLPYPVALPAHSVGLLVFMLSSLRQLLRWASWILHRPGFKYVVLGLPRIEYLRVLSWFFFPLGIEYFELSPTPILVFAEVMRNVPRIYQAALGRSKRFSERIAKWRSGKDRTIPSDLPCPARDSDQEGS